MARNDDTTRRRVLGLGGAVGAATVVTGGLLIRDAIPDQPVPGEVVIAKPPEVEPTKGTEPLEQVPRRVLGKTGKSIPILAFGTGMGLDPRFDPKVAEALRYGVNYLDTADCYDGGQCEPAVASFHTRLKNRDKLWITSKSDAHDPEGFKRTLEQSMSKLKTDTIDLFLLHNLEDPANLSPALEAVVDAVKASGQIRHFGFSCHGPNVAELLHVAAKTPWVEAVMFRYNFRKYGDKELNAAMDAAHKADVGLIAMKTQGAEASFRDAWLSFQQSKWSKHQAVLKAVWADQRIASICSAMDNFTKLRQNIAAALDKGGLGKADQEAIERYRYATRSHACDGCEHLCSPACDAPVRIADTLRYLMYHNVYDNPERARALFARLPAEARTVAGVDFSGAEEACPHGVQIGTLMARACTVLG